MEFASLLGIALWALLPGFIAKKKGRSFWGYYFLSFLISPLITTIITACLSRVNNDVDLEEPQPQKTIVAPVSEPLAENDEICFCRKCGERLINGSQFCRKCGTQVVKE